MLFTEGSKYKWIDERERLFRVTKDEDGEDLNRSWNNFYFDIENFEVVHGFEFQDSAYRTSYNVLPVPKGMIEVTRATDSSPSKILSTASC